MHASEGSIVLVEVHGEDYIPLAGDGEVTTLGVTNLSLDIQGSFTKGYGMIHTLLWCQQVR